MIPKIIHYCWFGHNEKPEIINKCIESWQKYCPDYQIIEWNESNFDINSNQYMKEAYDDKAWAFVSDVARLMIVYENGGIYMDTDVELSASLDDWLDLNAFYIFESGRYIASGLGFGAEKHHPSVKQMLSFYESHSYLVKGKAKPVNCPVCNTEELIERYKELKRDGTKQIVEDVLFLSWDEYSRRAYHYGTKTWVKDKDIKKKPYKDTKTRRILRSPKAFSKVESLNSKKITYLYTFLVYDLLDNGFTYYFKRMIRKLKKK